MDKKPIGKRIKKSKKIRHNEYYDLQETFDKLFRDSEEEKEFTDLMSIIQSNKNLLLAFRNVKKNSGASTPGVDGKNIDDIANLEDDTFLRIAKNKLMNYFPKAVKRVDIPKPNGKTRPLGIPTIWDRIIQQCILQVLEPICEAKFYTGSYGFRPNRSTEHAIAHTYKMMQINKLHYVVDVDIEGFFDNVNHNKLIKQMWTLGIRDKNLICIIKKMLKAQIELPNGTRISNEKGTPQGGILSPLLSNIVLNEFDWWIASQWENMKTKTKSAKPLDRRWEGKGIDKGNQYKALRTSNLKEVFIVRYADDFKLFCSNKADAENIFHASKMWLKDRLGLEVSEEKSKIVNVRNHYSEFLGFKIKVIKKGTKWTIKSHIADKAISRIKIQLKERMMKIKNPKGSNDEIRSIGRYNSTVIGIHNYYHLATMVSQDLGKISYQIQSLYKSNKLGRRVKQEGTIKSIYIKQKYGKSNQLRFIRKTAIVPVGYIRHKNPMNKRTLINKYTPEGRALIHKNLQNVDLSIMRYIMENPVPNRTIEYNDNRISLYSAQHGKCAISKTFLIPNNMECHHKKPKTLGGTDAYENLVLVSREIHNLIHWKDVDKLNLLLSFVKLDKRQTEKLNKLRLLADNLELELG